MQYFLANFSYLNKDKEEEELKESDNGKMMITLSVHYWFQ